MHRETLNKTRVQRAHKIATAIMHNWFKTNKLGYIVRATQAVEGVSLSQLRTHYFQVGVGEGELVELPFIDMLTVFSILEKHAAQLQDISQEAAQIHKRFKIRSEISGQAPDDEEAVRLLRQIRVETPFDKGTHLRVEEA